MLYDSYKKRIEMLARVRDTLYRFRAIILSVPGALMVLWAAYLIAKGSFTGALTLEKNEIEYGEQLVPNAKALFSSVSYQFKTADSDEWTDSSPVMPGNYEVRAVSNGGFGVKKYSETLGAKIVPRELNIIPTENYAVYGEELAFTADRLVYGDTLSEYDFLYIDRNGDKATIKAENILVSDKNGSDIISAYKISCPETEVSFVPRELTVSTGSADKVYDGLPLMSDSVFLSDNTPLAYEDRADISALKPNLSITNVGALKNAVDLSLVKIFNSEGADVTRYYDIGEDFGALKVTKRRLTVTTGSAFMWYEEGKSLSCAEFTLTDGSLVSGHRLEISGDVTSIETEQKSENKFSVRVLDASGADVSENYEISYIYGTLEIQKKIVLTVRPLPLEQVYNGKPLTYKSNNWWSIINPDALREGDYYEISAVLSGSLTDVGEGEGNIIITEAHFYNSQGDEVFCYELNCESGVIKVTPAKVTVYSADIVTSNKDYFSVTTKTEDLIIGGALPEGYYFKCVDPYTTYIEWIWVDSKLDSYYIEYSCFGSPAQGEYASATESLNAVNRIGEIKIYDGKGNDVTDNFDISRAEGVIK